MFLFRKIKYVYRDLHRITSVLNEWCDEGVLSKAQKVILVGRKKDVWWARMCISKRINSLVCLGTITSFDKADNYEQGTYWIVFGKRTINERQDVLYFPMWN